LHERITDLIELLQGKRTNSQGFLGHAMSKLGIGCPSCTMKRDCDSISVYIFYTNGVYTMYQITAESLATGTTLVDSLEKLQLTVERFGTL